MRLESLLATIGFGLLAGVGFARLSSATPPQTFDEASMDEQTVNTALFIGAGVITAIFIGFAVWFVSCLAKTLEVMKASVEAAKSIATSVEKFEALMNKQRTEGRKQA